MLRVILKKTEKQHHTRQQLYVHQQPITKTIKIKWTRHAGHCWRNRDELISDLPLWTPLHGQAKAGRPARIFMQRLGAEKGCSTENLPEAMDDRERWRGRVRDIRADGATWGWCIYIYIYLIAGKLICNCWFHAVFTQPSSDRKIKILEKSKKSKNIEKLLSKVISRYNCG